MGKIRVKTFGNEEEEKKQKEKLSRKKEAKKIEKKAEVITETKAIPAEPEVKKETKEIVEKKPKKKEKFQKKQEAFHSTQYFTLVKQVDRNKVYPLSEALELLEKLQRNKFDETVELHINTVSTGIFGNITLPHGTGKKTRVAIANEGLIAEIEKGIINFDVLVAEPELMSKLAKVAKVLGPRGLMPNPKNGTITAKPEEVAKKYAGGQINFKTEAKAPIIHLTVGKISFGPEKLTENIEALIAAVKKANIINATLKSTMSPGLKIKL